MKPKIPAAEHGLHQRPVTRVRERTWEEYLSEQLHRERIIFLWGEINFATAHKLIMEMLTLQSQGAERDVNLYITSPGGSDDAMLAIYDTMQFISCEVATYCVGMASSAAAIILAAGAKGKRHALPHSRIMIHQGISWGLGGQAADIEIHVEEAVKTERRINELLAKHTARTVDEIASDTQRDRWMTPLEAKEYGIVDEIIDTSPKKSKS